MNVKNVLMTTVVALLLCIGGFAYMDHIKEENSISTTHTVSPNATKTSNDGASNPIKQGTISADHAIFETFDDALSASQVVAEVVATEKSQNMVVDEGDFSTSHTVTEVKVNQVFENNTEKEIADIINVLEPTYISESTDGPIRFNYEDYTKMEPGSKYTVFLVWNEKRQGYWINALEQGKFNIDHSDKAEMSMSSENSQYAALKNDVIQNLYGNFLENNQSSY